jgi:hypothetical protein
MNLFVIIYTTSMYATQHSMRKTARMAPLILGVCCWVMPIWAFSFGGQAYEVPVTDTALVQDGDMISFDADTGEYARAHTLNEHGLFGVAVFDPVVLVRTSNEVNENDELVSVMQDGEVFVNVSDIAGDILRGDMVTPGLIVAFGEKQPLDSQGYILGVAMEDAEWAGVDDTGRRFGKVRVAMHITEYRPEIGIGTGVSVAEMLQDVFGTGTGANGIAGNFDENRNNAIFDILQLFRYTIGSLLAVISIAIAVKKLGELFSQGIISVGRNPLAKSQIHAILLWNSLLILLLSTVGFFIGIAIIFFS